MKYFQRSCLSFLVLLSPSHKKIAKSSLVIRKAGGNAKTFGTANYKYYGPQSLAVNGTLIFLSSYDACHPKRNIVEDLVVIARPGACDVGTRYERLNEAGAKGYVHLVTWSPGIYTYRRHTWSPSILQGLDMVMVSARDSFYDGDFVNEGSLSGGNVATIKPRHETYWEDMYSSPFWICLIRIAVPLAAFWVSSTCSKIACEAFIFKTDLEAGAGHSAYVAWMTLCEAVTIFCIGVAFVLDIYGQMLMPVQYLYFFYNLFLGVGLFWSVAVALTIREEVRYLRDFTPRRPVLIAFKWPLRAILVNGLILDFVLPFRTIFPSIAGGSAFPYIIIVQMSSVMMLQCSAAGWFLYQVGSI